MIKDNPWWLTPHEDILRRLNWLREGFDSETWRSICDEAKSLCLQAEEEKRKMLPQPYSVRSILLNWEKETRNLKWLEEKKMNLKWPFHPISIFRYFMSVYKNYDRRLLVIKVALLTCGDTFGYGITKESYYRSLEMFSPPRRIFQRPRIHKLIIPLQDPNHPGPQLYF